MVKIGLWKEQGVFLIHIRDYKQGKGCHIPCVKGIALTKDVWDAFLRNLDHIGEDVEELYAKTEFGRYHR